MSFGIKGKEVLQMKYVSYIGHETSKQAAAEGIELLTLRASSRCFTLTPHESQSERVVRLHAFTKLSKSALVERIESSTLGIRV